MLKIMPLGDSTTAGYNLAVGGYRKPLLDMLSSIGVSACYVGGQTSYNPTGRSDLVHQGINGRTTTGILADISTGGIIATYAPDVVLLLIGVNDVSPHNQFPLSLSLANYGAILEGIFAARPAARVVGMGIPLAASIQASVAALNEGFAGVAGAFTGGIVNWLNRPTIASNWFQDGVHPAVEGYNVIALAWASWLAQVLQA